MIWPSVTFPKFVSTCHTLVANIANERVASSVNGLVRRHVRKSTHVARRTVEVDFRLPN